MRDWFKGFLFMLPIFAVGIIVGTAAESFLDVLLPTGWENRLMNVALIFGAIYAVDRVQKLENSVKNLTSSIERLRQRVGQ